MLESSRAWLSPTQEHVKVLANNGSHARIQMQNGKVVWRNLEDLDFTGSCRDDSATGGYTEQMSLPPVPSSCPGRGRFLHESSGDAAGAWAEVAELLREVGEHGVPDCDDLCNTINRIRSLRTGKPQTAALTALRQSIGRLEENGLGTQSEFLARSVAWAAHHALSLPCLLPDGLQVLRQNVTTQQFLSRRTCAALASSAFLGVLYSDQGSGIPGYDLSFILDADKSKTLCLLSYFVQVSKEGQDTMDQQFVSFARRAAPNPVAFATEAFWQSLDLPLQPIFVRTEGAIEAAAGAIQADFANKFLGGGVLRGGNVQEEIRFSVCPECLVGMLFCEQMLEHEAIFIVGAQQYSDYSGYGASFRFAGMRTAREPLDAMSRPNVQIVAFDALCFPGDMQYRQGLVLRELQKVYVACQGDISEDSVVAASASAASEARHPAFATGNWGCGVFGGDPQLKSLIQWLAASANGREVWYYMYRDGRVSNLGAVACEVITRNWSCRGLFAALTRCRSGCVFESLLNDHPLPSPGREM